MTFKNTKVAYGSMARFFHWTMALLVIGMLFVGFFLSTWGSNTIYNVHKLTGLFILLLVLIRIAWASGSIRPDLPAKTTIVARISVKMVQGMLYICLFLMPISGWAMATASGHLPHIGSVLIPMPFIPINNNVLAGFFYQIHETVAILFIILISLHVVAALKHFFIDKDNVLYTMLPDVMHKMIKKK